MTFLQIAVAADNILLEYNPEMTVMKQKFDICQSRTLPWKQARFQNTRDFQDVCISKQTRISNSKM